MNLSKSTEPLWASKYALSSKSKEFFVNNDLNALYENISNNENYSNISFLHVDVDICRDICEKYFIEGMPTFILFKNSLELYRFSGANETKLNDMLIKCK